MSIISASTITSSSSKAFSLSSTTSTSSSQYSAFSGTKTSRNFLSELLDSEAIYLNDLKIIDSKISPLWMKQTTHTAPDFTELIKDIRDIILANKRFYMKLAKCAGNTHAARELGNILIQWVTDLEVPYSNYSRSFVPNLNNRKDILANGSITQLLKSLSQSSSRNISLDSLFSAPIQHLKYYQDLYTRLLNTEPNNDLTHAICNLKVILAISQERLASTNGTSTLSQQIYTQQKISTATCTKKSFIVQDEDFSYYTEVGELSSQSSSGDNCGSTLDDYRPSLLNNEYYGKYEDGYSATGEHEDLATIQPRVVKIVDAVSANPKMATIVTSTTATSSSPTVKPDTSAIQMTYIQPATAKVMVLDNESIDDDQQQGHSSATTSSTNNTPTRTLAPGLASTLTSSKTPISNPTTSTPTPVSSSKPDNTSGASMTIPPPQKTLAPASSEPSRPISPRAVQVQQAVKPVAAMQAVSQKTDDYFGVSSIRSPIKPPPARKESANSNLPERSSSATPGATALPRTSSIRVSSRNIHSTSPLSTQQTSIPSSSQSPLVTHHQPPLSNMNDQSIRSSLPLLHSSSLKSTEQLGHGTHPPRKDSMGSLPPPKDSNDAPHMSSRSTNSATSAVYHQHPHSSTAQLQLSYAPQQEDDQQNSIRQVLYSNNQCEVFRWKDQSWYAVDGQCTVQVRLTFGGRSNVAVQLQPSGQLYLNIWVVPNMVVGQPSPTDVSISAIMMEQQENYLIHFTHPTDASNLLAMLHRMHHEASRQPPPPPSSSSSTTIQRQRQRQQNRPEPAAAAVELRDDTPSVEDVPQTLKSVFQCKCKLFVQNETSKWNSLGNTAMRISHQLPSQKTHVYIEDDKNKAISSVIRSGNVERLTNKRITFLLIDDNDKSSMVYMVQLKDEQNGNRVFDYLKTQNAAHGW